MSATTIKLEGPLLVQLQQIKLRAMSISAFVSSLIEDAVRRSTMAEAAPIPRFPRLLPVGV